MNKPLVSAVIIVVLIATAGAWYFFHPSAPAASSPENDATVIAADMQPAPGFAAASSTPAATEGPLAGPRQAPAGYKEYRNATYRFSLFYPQDLTVHEFDEGGGASTVTFENAKTVQGFQIFIVPYGDSQVNAERFKKDVPSGVMKEPQDIRIDGTLATIFFSTNPLLGDTREVWCIHGGYLFEVTTPKLLDEWLGTIMQTWRFI